MADTRGYVAFTGEGSAFGFGKREENGWQIVLGGLQPDGQYTMMGDIRMTADANGNWRGAMQGEMPLYIAQRPSGRLTLYDAERISRSDAVLLCKPQATKKTAIRAVDAPAERVQSTPAEKKKSQKKPVSYRTRLNGKMIDALPVLAWPGESEKWRSYFENNRPVRLLDAPGWRFVCVQAAAPRCYVGYRAQGDRVCEMAWAVEARGALIPPKGLQGYRYTRCGNDRACWLLTKSV